MTYLRNYAVLNVKDRLARIDGVGQVQLFGAGDYSMRVWLDPQKVAERGLSAERRGAARSAAQNVQAAAGVVGASPSLPGLDMQLSINAQGRLQSEEEFGDIVVKTGANGADHPAARRRPPRARRRRILAALAAQQQVGRRPSPIFQAPGSNAHRDLATASARRWRELKQEHAGRRGLLASSTTRRSSCAPRSRR